MEIIYLTWPYIDRNRCRRWHTDTGTGWTWKKTSQQRNRCTSVLCFNAASSAAPHITTRPHLIIKCCLVKLKGTVKRPKFGNGPLIRHPLSKLLKNHISARTGFRDLVQRGDWLYIFFWTNKKEIIGGHHWLYMIFSSWAMACRSGRFWKMR